MNRSSLCLGAFGIAFTSLVQAQDWVPLSQGGGNSYDVKAGSVEYTLTEGGREPIVAFIVRVRNASKATVEFEKNYVRLSHCEQGFGKLVTTDLNGRAKYDNDFILNGGNIASTIAEMLCSIAKKDDANRPANVSPSRRF